MFQVKPNIGIINALIRITFGLTILTWCTSKLVKCPWRDSYLFIAILGAMKVGEGIVRYCPVTALLEQNNVFKKDNQSDSSHPTSFSTLD